MMATTVSKPPATGVGSIEEDVVVPKPTKHDIETVRTTDHNATGGSNSAKGGLTRSTHTHGPSRLTDSHAQ